VFNLQGQADATWVFRGWEGVDAELKGVELNVFQLEKFGVPYGYTPILVALPETLRYGKAFFRSWCRAWNRCAAYRTKGRTA
jgi:hypothetical protein